MRGPDVADPKSFTERVEVASSCAKALELTMPLLIDEIDDRVGRAYGGYPDRLYVIGADGKVAYQGGPGPRGFKPAEAEEALAKLLAAGGEREPLRRRI